MTPNHVKTKYLLRLRFSQSQISTFLRAELYGSMLASPRRFTAVSELKGE
jgi:hypothetical protein